jgi:hypothetical protein
MQSPEVRFGALARALLQDRVPADKALILERTVRIKLAVDGDSGAATGPVFQGRKMLISTAALGNANTCESCGKTDRALGSCGIWRCA